MSERSHAANPTPVPESTLTELFFEAVDRFGDDVAAFQRFETAERIRHAVTWEYPRAADLPEVVQDVGRMAPAGQLWSTVEDLGRFGRVCSDVGACHLSGQLYNARQCGSPASCWRTNSSYGRSWFSARITQSRY